MTLTSQGIVAGIGELREITELVSADTNTLREENRCASAQVRLLRGNAHRNTPRRRNRRFRHRDRHGTTSDEAEVWSGANTTFTAWTTAPRRAGSGRFAAGKDGAVGELVGTAKETTEDQKRPQRHKTRERATDR